MVQLDCIEQNCNFKTQDLGFDEAEKILNLHLDRKHPLTADVNNPKVTIPHEQHSSHPSYVLLLNIPFTSKSSDIEMMLIRQGLAGAEAHIIETEAGKSTGWIYLKINFQIFI